METEALHILGKISLIGHTPAYRSGVLAPITPQKFSGLLHWLLESR